MASPSTIQLTASALGFVFSFLAIAAAAADTVVLWPLCCYELVAVRAVVVVAVRCLLPRSLSELKPKKERRGSSDNAVCNDAHKAFVKIDFVFEVVLTTFEAISSRRLCVSQRMQRQKQ